MFPHNKAKAKRVWFHFIIHSLYYFPHWCSCQCQCLTLYHFLSLRSKRFVCIWVHCLWWRYCHSQRMLSFSLLFFSARFLFRIIASVNDWYFSLLSFLNSNFTITLHHDSVFFKVYVNFIIWLRFYIIWRVVITVNFTHEVLFFFVCYTFNF